MTWNIACYMELGVRCRIMIVLGCSINDIETRWIYRYWIREEFILKGGSWERFCDIKFSFRATRIAVDFLVPSISSKPKSNATQFNITMAEPTSTTSNPKWYPNRLNCENANPRLAILKSVSEVKRKDGFSSKFSQMSSLVQRKGNDSKMWDCIC